MIEKKERPGSLLIDALLAIVIFGAVVAAFSNGILQGQQGTLRGNNRTRAVYLAEEGLQAIRSIRDQAGGYTRIKKRALDQDDGIQVVTGTGWMIVDEATVIDGMFTRRIIFSAGANTNQRKVSSIVTWSETQGDSLSVTQTSYITNWRETPIPTPDWSEPVLKGSFATVDDSFEAVAIHGTGAYVVGNQTTASGFYIFDISDPSSPDLEHEVHINAKLTDDGWDSRAWDIVIQGSYAYVGTNSTNGKKIKIINIAQTPVVCCTAEITLAGGTSGDVRGLAISGTTLYASRQPGTFTADFNEFMRFDVSTPASPVADGVTNADDIDAYGIVIEQPSMSSTGVFAAANDPKELVLMDIGKSPNPEEETNEDVTGTYVETYTVAYLTGSVFLGTQWSSGGPEVFAFDATVRPLVAASNLDLNGFGSSENAYDIAISQAGEAGLLAAYLRRIGIPGPCGPPKKHFFVSMDFSDVNAISFLFDDDDFDAYFGCNERGYGIALRESDQMAVLVSGNDFLSPAGGSLIILQPSFSFGD